MQADQLEFRSLPGLWGEYDQITPSMTFKSRTLADAADWQIRLREKIAELLGGFPEQRCDLSPKVLDILEDREFRQELVAIQTQPGEFMPCYVLSPHQKGDVTLKPVIALHGHGTWGAEAIIRAPEDPLGIELNQQMNYDYAGQLCRRGFMVFVPELRGFGKRLEHPDYQEGDAQWISSCYQVGVNALLLGKTLLGMRVYDVMRLVDYIHTRDENLSDHLGCVGLSGGGMATLFTTALDIRITCAIVSGYFNTFRDSIMAIRHCLCNYIPGIVQIAEMADIAGLVAPRPLLIESGTQDPIFPVEATRRAYAQLQGIYAVFEATDKLDIDIFEGDHGWSGTKAYPWLRQWMEI
jgi:dienelactone hydrolase